MGVTSLRSLRCAECLPMYAVFMTIRMTRGRFDAYSDGHVDCCRTQSSLIGDAIGRDVAWGLVVKVRFGDPGG